MATKYVYGINPFRDFLVKSIEAGLDISNKKYKEEIETSFIFFLENILQNKKDVIHLDFKIIKDHARYRVIGKNPPSAFWLSGVWVENVDILLKNNVFIIDDRKYSYNEKTNELTFKIIYD